jgi:hypothetical protein
MNASTTAYRPIYTSCAHWKDVSFDKVQESYALGEYLNDRLSLSDFGVGLDRIWFVALIMLPHDRIHTNGAILRRKTKTLEIFWKMDYQRVMTATLPAFREYLLEFFLQTLRQVLKGKKMKDFDREAFLTALEMHGRTWLANDVEVGRSALN